MAEPTSSGVKLQEMLPLAALLAVALFVAAFSSPIASREPLLAAVLPGSVVALTNDERIEKHLPTLARNPLLDRAAQAKAEDMAAKGYYAHVSPEGLTPMHFVEQAGYAYLIIGENLVVNRSDAKEVVDAFMGSPGHKANILRKDFTEIGVGVASGTYKGKDATFTVQVFAAPYPKPAIAKAAPSQENVKPVSTAAKAPLPAKAPVSAIVPRAVAAEAAPSRASTTAETIQASALAEKVKELIKPISDLPQATSSRAVATTTADAFPSSHLFLADAPPIELAIVSPSRGEALPPQAGSRWSMQFRLFVGGFMQKARGLFGS